MSTYVFWFSEASLHVSPLVAALAERPDVDVQVVVEREVGFARRRQGWQDADHGGAAVHVMPSWDGRPELIRSLPVNAVHVFWGLGVYRLSARSMRLVRELHNDCSILVFSESWRTDQGLRSWLRATKYAWKKRVYGRLIDGILVPGAAAKRQFSSLAEHHGLELFDFPYVVQQIDVGFTRDASQGCTRLIYVGSLAKHKGVDLLLDACATMQGECELTIVGDGPQRADLERYAESIDSGMRITFRGNQNTHHVRELMASHDVLVLPSRYDGWGAVVNEALSVGTLALVSSRAGSASLCGAEEPFRGWAVNSSAELRAALAAAQLRSHSLSDREQLALWAQETISPKRVAQYLEDIVHRLRHGARVPPAPWT